ncbi:MAG: carbohydrate porin [Bacteroidota bacterium]|nr:carbohydrate porin [Bacteroidota bacterium]
MGAVVQALYHDWAFRTALTTVPIEANGPQLQFRFNKAMGMVWELEKTHLFQQNEERFTTLHAGIFMNQANMGNYRLALNGGTAVPDITASRSYGRTKWGYYFSTDNHFGWFNHFFRLSWNDGKNETWAFTEIDRSIATGIQLKGSRWKRNQDHFALAFVSNGLSQDHRYYLAKGGYGFLVGDGQLHYGREDILEAYYSMHLSRQVYLSPDYQFVSHPGYNRDRGPVHIVAFRLHAFL